MGFLEKVKDFFYDEEEIDVEVPIRKKEKTKKEKIEKEETNKFNIYDIEKETTKEKEIIHKPKVKKVQEQEISERELFRAERTFNFPMDIDETREFKREETPIARQERVEEREPVRKPTTPPRYNNYSTYTSTFSPYKKDVKKFKPTPVISPIYGVLNENYKKEDIVDTGKTRTMMESAPTEFDKVRQKAYKELDDELEKTFNETPKDIFFNMDEDEKEQEETKPIDDIKEEYEEEPYKKDEVIITYGEVEEDDITPDVAVAEEISIKQQETDEEDFEVPTLSRKKEKNEEKDDESDVFKIIDNMYNDEEDEEGEEGEE